MMGLRQQPPPESLGIFCGFNVKYPEFTVVTPQMGYSFSVRCLNVSEVSRLKTSATTPAKATDLINRTLWDAIVARPPHITNYDTFLRMTTLRDREALIYALYLMTFGDEREFRVICDSCSAERTLKVKLSSMFSIAPYPGSAGMRETYKTDRATGEIQETDPVMEAAILRAKKQEEEYKSVSNARIDQQPPLVANEDLSEEDDPADCGIGLGSPVKAIMPPKKKMSRHQESESKSSGVSSDISRNMKPGSTVNNLENGIPRMVRVEQSPEDVAGTIISLNIPVVLPIAGITCVIHQPTLLDECDIMNNVPFLQKKQTDIINETLIIKRFEIYKEGDSRPIQTVTDREDILRGYQSLPNPDKKSIYDAFRENFADYGISLSTNWDCMSCGEENTMDLEIVAQFFRMVAIS